MTIYCRYCAAPNTVALGVREETRCRRCREVILLAPVERPKALQAPMDRTGGVLRVVCPHCGFLNELAGFDAVYIFLCRECGEAIEVVEAVQ